MAATRVQFDATYTSGSGTNLYRFTITVNVAGVVGVVRRCGVGNGIPGRIQQLRSSELLVSDTDSGEFALLIRR